MNDIAFKQFNEKALVPCHHCGRTFLPDSLKRHQNRCTADRPFKPLNRNKKKPEKPQVNSFDNQALPAIKNRHSKKIDLDEMMGGGRNRNKKNNNNNNNNRRNKNPYGGQKRKVQKPVQKPNNNYYEDSNVSEFSDDQDDQDFEIPLKAVEKPRMAAQGRKKSNKNMRKVGRPAKTSTFSGIGGSWETDGTYTYCRPKGGDRPFYGWGSDKSYSKSNLGSSRQAPSQSQSQSQKQVKNQQKRKLYGNTRQQNKQSNDNLSNTQGSSGYGRSKGRGNNPRNGGNTGRNGSKGGGPSTGRGTGRRGKSPMRGHGKPKVSKQLDDFINETFGTSEKSTPRNRSNNARRGKEKVKRVSLIRVFKDNIKLIFPRCPF